MLKIGMPEKAGWKSPKNTANTINVSCGVLLLCFFFVFFLGGGVLYIYIQSVHSIHTCTYKID